MVYRFPPSSYLSPSTRYTGSHGHETLNDSRHNVCKSESISRSTTFPTGGGKIRTKRKKYKKRTGRKKYKRRTERKKYKRRTGWKKYKRRTNKIKNKY